MNTLRMRDELFSRFHGEVLKHRGFRKRGNWITRDVGPFTHSFYLRASRFGSTAEAVFWIDVQIFSEPWLSLVFPERSYNGPKEGTPSLFLRELGTWFDPPQTSHRIEPGADTTRLFNSMCRATESAALPILDGCESLEGALRKLPDFAEDGSGNLVLAGLARLARDEQQARHYMELARQEASHENDLRFLRLREEAIWRHAV